MIVLTKITNTEIFAFITVLVFLKTEKTRETVKKVGYFFKK